MARTIDTRGAGLRAKTGKEPASASQQVAGRRHHEDRLQFFNGFGASLPLPWPEITVLPSGHFLVIERDNLTGAFSQFKSIVEIDLSDGSATRDEKEIADLLGPLRAANGWIHDKPEGLAVSSSGQVYVVTDNDRRR